jgi:hypothetical protein
MISLKDPTHLHREDIHQVATQIFQGSDEDAQQQWNIIAQHAYTWPNGMTRYSRGANLQQLLRSDTKHPKLPLPEETVVAISNMLQEKHIKKIVLSILQDEDKRRKLVNTFTIDALNALRSKELEAISQPLLTAFIQNAHSPEERADVLIMGLGKEQAVDGLAGHALAHSQ